MIRKNGRLAINVKVHMWGPGTKKVMEKFACTEDIAGKALEIIYERLRHDFWFNDAPFALAEVYGENVGRIYAEGRSAGWLTVEGIPDDPQKWEAFESKIREVIHYNCQDSFILSEIAAYFDDLLAETIGEIVQKGVIANLTGLISYVLSTEEGPYTYEDIDNWDGQDIYEWYLVSEDLYHELESRGHYVLGNQFWGRAATGQRIHMDKVFEDIAVDRYFDVDR